MAGGDAPRLRKASYSDATDHATNSQRLPGMRKASYCDVTEERFIKYYMGNIAGIN